MNQDSLLSQVVLTVDTVEDQNDGSEVNGLSIRDAIILANAEPNKKYIINIPSGEYDLTITESGSLDITSNIELIGDSAGDTIISASFLGDRIFDIYGGGILTLANFTLQDANHNQGNGGAILIEASGQAFIDNVIIAQSRTNNGRGGAIANNGYLELTDSAMFLNSGALGGGGIFNGKLEEADATIPQAVINRTSIIFNSTDSTLPEGQEEEDLGGGGIFNGIEGKLTVFNTTISNNISPAGGGIWTEGDETQIINSTIAQNQANQGAGVLSVSIPSEGDANVGFVTLRNSIVAENIGDTDIEIAFPEGIEGAEGGFDFRSSHNLIGSSANGIFPLNNNNLVGTINSPIDPLINDIPQEFETTDNASTQLVQTLQPDSPAIDAGLNSSLNIQELFTDFDNLDQTQQSRINNGTVDLGSVESGMSEGDTLLNNPIYRFQNNQRLGTYLYVGQKERKSVIDNFPEFTQEGLAFQVANNPSEDLIAIYRFHNDKVPGTYLYTNAQEREGVLRNYSNFREEGIAFYTYSASANKGVDIFRLQNLDEPGTYLFVTEGEKDNILGQFSNFLSEGVAFEVNL